MCEYVVGGGAKSANADANEHLRVLKNVEIVDKWQPVVLHRMPTSLLEDVSARSGPATI